MRLDFEQLVFVCTGNTCRSPRAEHLFNALIGCGSGWQATSAGLMAGAGFPASREAIHVMQEKGLNISGHRSRLFSAEIAQSADLIIGLTNGHTQVIKAKYPRFEEKIFTLKSFGNNESDLDVTDPIGSSLEVYRTTRDEIEKALVDLILYLKKS